MKFSVSLWPGLHFVAIPLRGFILLIFFHIKTTASWWVFNSLIFLLELPFLFPLEPTSSILDSFGLPCASCVPVLWYCRKPRLLALCSTTHYFLYVNPPLHAACSIDIVLVVDWLDIFLLPRRLSYCVAWWLLSYRTIPYCRNHPSHTLTSLLPSSQSDLTFRPTTTNEETKDVISTHLILSQFLSLKELV